MKRLTLQFALHIVLAGFLALSAPALAVAQAPSNAWDVKPVALPDPNGEKHTVADWKGKVILLNFWATWCLPCQTEIQHLKRWQQQHGKAGLQVVGIGLDDARKVRNFARSLDINYPVLAAGAAGSSILAQWGDPDGEVPYTLLIAPDGSIPYVQRGVFTDTAFERFVKPLLKP